MSIPDRPGYDEDRDRDYSREDYGGFPQSNPTSVPGVFLMIVGIICLLGSSLELLRGVQLTNTPLVAFEAQLDKMKRLYPQVFANQNINAEDAKNQGTVMMFVLGGVGLVAALIMIMGGMRMRALQSYGLAVAASVLAMIPCVTCAGCCGLGQGIGIWALVVLLKPEVKALFR